MTWQGGVFTGPGSMAIQTALSSATLTIDGLSGGGMTLDTQQIVNGGNINFTTALPPLSLNSNAQIINNTLFTLSSDIGIGTVDLTGKIINSPGGTFQKTGGVGTTPINTIFDNNGTVSIAPGLAISFNQGGNHTGSFSGPGATFKFDGSHTFNPGSSFSAGGDVAILAGTFSVNTLLGINGNLSNAGTLLFGPPASTQMNVGQNYTQAGTGTFSVKLNGTAPGQYDQLNVTGVATLAGTLNATLGYTPSNGDTFFPLTFGSRVSDFGTKILPTYANGAIQASYTASALQLQAVALSADLSGSVSATTNPVNAGGSETWQVGISNSGPDAAASVVVNLSFTGGGTMLTATGPGFTCTINPPASAQCTNPFLLMFDLGIHLGLVIVIPCQSAIDLR